MKYNFKIPIIIFSLILFILPSVFADQDFGVISGVTVVSLRENLEEEIVLHKGKSFIPSIENESSTKELTEPIIDKSKSVSATEKEETKITYFSVLELSFIIIASLIVFILLYYILKKIGIKHFEEHWIDILFKRNVNH